MITYCVMMRPKQGIIQNMQVNAETEYNARKMALALWPSFTIVRIWPVSYRDA